jgi:hypothetical protein
MSRKDEKKIIEHTASSCVIGRSGTGYVLRSHPVHTGHGCELDARRRKTTVILFKMLGIERAWKKQSDAGPRPRQIFITKSRRLADKVEEDYVNFLFSLCSNSDMSEYDREQIRRRSTRKMDTFDPDDGWASRDDLPRRYSQLSDSNFPLFVTLDMVSMTFATPRGTKAHEGRIFDQFIALLPSRGRYESRSL